MDYKQDATVLGPIIGLALITGLIAWAIDKYGENSESESVADAMYKEWEARYPSSNSSSKTRSKPKSTSKSKSKSTSKSTSKSKSKSKS